MKNLLFLSLYFITATTFAQYENITLPLPKKATYFYSQVEPSIYLNPKNTNEVIAGSVMNDYYYSIDGGKTWKSKSIKSKWGVNGDPVMLIDTLERYFYFHLSNIDGVPLVGGMVSQYSKKIKGKFKYQGHTIANGKYHDKQWVALDPRTNHIYMTWTQFDAYDSNDPKHHSNILFSKTVDGGLNWTDPVDISSFPGDCKDNDETAEGAVPAIGPNGEIYVAWARDDSLWFNVSIDDGKTWLESEKHIADQPNGWVIDIPGIFRCNGLPVTVCDLSKGPNNGTIYVNWADQRNGEENTDIWLTKSTDGGENWSEAKRINNDESKRHQFLTWLTVDQATGYLYCVYYDRRNQKERGTDVYLSYSTDGGDSFVDVKISESAFKPNPKIFFGDYTNISVHEGVIRPIWTRLHNGKISLHTALISHNDLPKE
jgi:hypothetical protein